MIVCAVSSVIYVLSVYRENRVSMITVCFTDKSNPYCGKDALSILYVVHCVSVYARKLDEYI